MVKKKYVKRKRYNVFLKSSKGSGAGSYILLSPKELKKIKGIKHIKVW